MTLPGESLQKITINIYEKDYEAMKTIYGDGYSVKIRDIVRKHLREWRQRGQEGRTFYD